MRLLIARWRTRLLNTLRDYHRREADDQTPVVDVTDLHRKRQIHEAERAAEADRVSRVLRRSPPR